MDTSQAQWKGLAWPVVMTVTVATMTVFFYKMFKVRMLFYRLKKQGLPMPQWDFGAGHLKVLPALLEKFPKGSMQSDAFTQLSYDFANTDGCFYIDVWPFTSPLLVVTSPEIAIQACQEYDLPKPDVLIPFFAPLTGGPNLFTMNGAEWKRSRALFNPGFSANVMLEHTSHILEEAEVYVEILREHAKKGDTFSLDKLTCNYMMDVIGSVTINAHLGSQRGYNELASALRSSIDWHCQDEELNPFVRWNPMRPIIEWHNGRKMNRYINAELDKRYDEWKQAKPTTRAKSVMDITIAEYMNKREAAEKLDQQFKSWASAQIRLFLFAGHDSTAATIVYSLYLLSKRPDALAKIRAEHDQVLGHDISRAAQTLRERPQLVNQLSYTNAVAKETLRLFAPASGMRGGLPNVYFRDKYGNKFPTENLSIWILHSAIQRNPDYWPDPHSFIPERWLVEPGHELYPPKGGWRPFEHGPRNCVGQTLAMLDVKITLAMVVREFDIKDMYEEFDQLHPRKGVKTVWGERAYQVPLGAAHPVDGFPCRVFLREGGNVI
ncbi:cytochrome P450 71B25 [Phaeosphaeriaceae sp. PMI808]|nr:cytochrome P450 71B25 [Phaeosphaeriaceae sp. PMI808]